MSIWDEAEQDIATQQAPTQSVWDVAEAEIELEEEQSSYANQLLGSLTKGGIRLGQAILEIPKHTAWLIGKAVDVPTDRPPQPGDRGYKLWEQELEKRKDPGYKPLGQQYLGLIKEHKQGTKSILNAHPEWEYEPPKNFLDLLTSPRKLSLAIAESTPLLVAAGIATVAGRPDLSVAMMYGAEGQEAHDQAIIDGATPEQAEQAYHIYGSVAGILEQLQLGQAIKIGKRGYQAVFNRTVQKIAKQGTKSITKEIVKTAAKEAIEEMSQGTWQEVTAKLVYDKSVPGGLWGFVDRRAQEGLIGGVMGAIPGIGGVTLAHSRNLIQGISAQNEISPEESTEAIANASQQVDSKATPEKQQEQLIEAILEETGRSKVHHPNFVNWVEENVKQLFTTKDVPVKRATNAPQVVAETHNKQGGSTIDLKTGKPTTKGFAISPYPDRTVKIPGKEISPEQIQEYAEQNKDLLEQKGHTIGTWFNEEDGNTYLDVTITEASKEKALKLGEEKEQIAIFDLEKFEEIPVEKKVGPKKLENEFVVFEGVQEGLPEEGIPDFKLYTLKQDIPGHPAGSTLSENTLREAGIPIPGEKIKAEIKPREISKKKALALGHKLPGILGMSEEARREYMQGITGKTSMKNMSLDEMRQYVAQLEQDVKESGLMAETPVEETIRATQEAGTKEVKKEIKGLEKQGFKAWTQNVKQNFTRYIDGLYRVERMLETIDGHTEGPNYKNIFMPVTQANNMAIESKRSRIEKAVKEFWKIAGGKKAVMQLAAKERQHVADKTKDNPSIDLAPMERIAIYLYAQNKNGLNHLQHGNFADFKDFETALKQIVESMAKEEKAIADFILDDMHKQFPRVRQAAILALGRDLTEQDNYFSLYLKDVDPEQQTDFLHDLLKQVGEKVGVQEPGEIKKRKKGARQPLRLDAFENYFYHINRIEQFVNLAPIAKSVGDIVNDKEYQKAINNVTDGHGGRILKDWLKHSVRGHAAESSSWIGRKILALRRNGIVYAIGGNIPSVMRQQLSGFNAMSVHPSVAFYAAQHWGEGKNPRNYRKLENRAMSKSQMMRTRNFDRIEIIINKQNPARRRILRKKPWSSKAVSWIRWQDKHTTVYAWNAFYDAALKSGAAQATFGLDGSEQTAIDFADKWVRRTQPMGGAEHLPDFFRGGVVERLLTTFQNQINNNFNFWYHDIYQAKKYGKIDNKLLAYRIMGSYVLPALAFGMIARGGGLPRTWKDVPFDLFNYTLGPAFIVGRIIYNAIHGFAGAGRGIEGIALTEIEKTIESMIRKDTKGVVRHGIKAVGASTGKIPAQAIRTSEGVIDLMTDETDDLRRLIWSEWSLGKEPKPSGGQAR